MVQKIFLLILNCFSTWSRRWFLNSMPLSDRIYLRHVWTGRYWLIKVDAIVSADLPNVLERLLANLYGDQLL